MVNVYTNNGQFNISESLMEAIKANQPEILLEDNKIKKSKDFENKAVSTSYDELLKFSLSVILSEIPADSMSPDDFEKFSNNMIKYYSMPKSPEKTHLKARIKSFLNDLNRENGTDLNFNDIEKNVSNEFEDNKSKIKNLNKEDALKYFANWQQKIADKSIELEKQEKEEERQRAEDKYFRKHNISNSDDQILFQQILLHGGDISNGIEINGKKLTQKQIIKRINRNPYFKKEWDKFKENEKAQKELQANSEEMSNTDKLQSFGESDYNPDNLEDLLNSQGLIDELNITESAAKKLAETAKESISSILGLFGTVQRNNSSLLKKNVANDNIQTQPQLKKVANEAANEPTTNINNSVNNNVANDNISSYKPSATGASRTAKGFLNLAAGGFDISPLFNGTPNEKKEFGVAMKYYKEYTKSKNNQSFIDNLMDYLIDKHSNEEMFNTKITEELKIKYKNPKQIENKLKELSIKLDKISAQFLGNVIYRLQVGDDSTFNEILRAVRFAPKIKERYYVSNESKLQMFGAREQALIFKNINSESVVTIFIATPLYAKATELGKQALKLTRHFKNIKA